MDNLGPLPTDFTINANCASELNDVYLLHTPLSDHDAYYLLRGPLDQTTCYPSGYTANTEQYYSPGRCPTGYTAPCQSINRAGTVEETVLTCCPTQGNYICQTDTGPWATTQGCASRFTTSTELTLSEVSDGVTSRATTTFGEIDAINAYSIQVRYQSTDFISSPSSTSMPMSTIETSSPTNTPQSTRSNTNKAIPGIVVGVLAAVFIAIGAIFLLVRRRRRQRQQQQQQPTPTQQIQHPHPYSYQHGYQEQQQHHHFGFFKTNPDGSQELDAPRGIAELESSVAPPRSR